jgi:hypothetical protein
MKGIIPQKARTAKMREFLTKEYYFALGKNTPWEDSTGLYQTDNNPPNENALFEFIAEPIVYKKPSLITAVVETSFDNSINQINLNNKFYSPVNANNHFSAGATEILIQLDVFLDDLQGSDSFRTAGLYSGLIVKPNINSNLLTKLTPIQVLTPGILEWTINLRAVNLSNTDKVSLAFIRQF